MIRHSLRFRMAALTTISVSSVFCLFSLFLYFSIRANMLRDIDFIVESKCRVLADSFAVESVEWWRAERLLEHSGGDMTVFVWRQKDQAVFMNARWPDALDPRDVARDLVLPEDWRERRAAGETPINPPMENSSSPGGEAPPGETGLRGWRRITTNILPAADPTRRYGAFSVGDIKIVMGTDQKFFMDRLAAFRRLLLIALAPALLLSFLLGIMIARRSLASLNSLVDGIEQITAKGLDRRISPERSDREFRKLISVFNDMLERLQRSFQESRRFTDAAAHELRSPLTILQGKLDEAMRAESPGSERQQTLAALMEEVARLKGITDRLLLLAKSDAGRLDLYKGTFRLDHIVKYLIDDAHLLAPDLEFHHDLKECVVECDSTLMMQVIHNLLSNAIKYNRARDGFVRIELEPAGNRVELQIANSGPPIPSEMTERIFDRFFRGDESHSRRVEGTGLGLSLAREIAHAHGGELTLNNSDAKETLFTLTLPVK